MLTGTIRPVNPNSPPVPQSMLPLGLTNAQPQAQGIMQVNKPKAQIANTPRVVDKEKLRTLFKARPELAQKALNTAKQKGYAMGGRVGYADGSQPQISQQQVAMAITMLKKGADMDTISSVTGIPPQMIQAVISKLQQGIQQQAPGGIAGYKTGGIPEIDYREKGGYVPPIGKKERADDIPAMLSNNEFVFTANAVRNAGGGDVKHGAKKMYALMKKLEGK
jgi:hypothetical protein